MPSSPASLTNLSHLTHLVFCPAFGLPPIRVQRLHCSLALPAFNVWLRKHHFVRSSCCCHVCMSGVSLTESPALQPLGPQQQQQLRIVRASQLPAVVCRNNLNIYLQRDGIVGGIEYGRITIAVSSNGLASHAYDPNHVQVCALVRLCVNTHGLFVCVCTQAFVHTYSTPCRSRMKRSSLAPSLSPLQR